MAEIPGFVWISVGIFVGAFSLFLGFIRPIETASFFQLMTVIGLGMIIFGAIKLRFPKKSKRDLIDEMAQRRAKRGMNDVEIDIDEFRNNPQKRQQAMQNKENFKQRYSGNTSNNTQIHHHTPQEPQPPKKKPKALFAKKAQVVGYCSQCGTPLLSKHKYCPICGNRV